MRVDERSRIFVAFHEGRRRLFCFARTHALSRVCAGLMCFSRFFPGYFVFFSFTTHLLSFVRREPHCRFSPSRPKTYRVSRIESRDPSSCRSLFTGFHVPAHGRNSSFALRVGSIVLGKKKIYTLWHRPRHRVHKRPERPESLFMLFSTTFTRPRVPVSSPVVRTDERRLRARVLSITSEHAYRLLSLSIPAAVRRLFPNKCRERDEYREIWYSAFYRVSTVRKKKNFLFL